MITVGSLFSGIGGIDLGLERAGMTVIWQAETDPYASKILAKHWPTVPNLGDVTTIDWSTVERPDLVCGGFPCQPVSGAGRRLAQRDHRWLWPAYAHCVRSLRPRYVLVENVPGLLVRGMGDVLGDLAACGYDTEWAGIPAAAVGAPHLRWRVFILARSEHRRALAHAGSGRGPGDDVRTGRDAARCGGPEVADADGARLGQQRGPQSVRAEQPAIERRGRDVEDTPGRRGERRGNGPGTPESGWALGLSPGPSGDSRRWWESEPDVGRVVNGVPARVDRLRCLGNAVVPQVAELVGRRLLAHIDGTAPL